jgi:hypothetical protein
MLHNLGNAQEGSASRQHSRLQRLCRASPYLLPQSNDLEIIDFHRMRLWDTNPEAIKMQSIWHDLRDKEVVDALL